VPARLKPQPKSSPDQPWILPLSSGEYGLMEEAQAHDRKSTSPSPNTSSSFS